MYIERIEISGVAGIKDLSIDLDARANVICGPNGIGKTTVLESIAHLFTLGETSILKRSATAEESRISGSVSLNGEVSEISLGFNEFAPNVRANMQGRYELANNLFSLKINRTFNYTPLHSVSRDTEKNEHTSYQEARDGVGFGDVKNWFVNRYLYSKHETLTPSQVSNYILARDSFSALNSDFEFSRVDASTNEILINSPTGEIYYEYLSSGFKSCLSIIFGIIKEVEFRFGLGGLNARDFQGIVLIDEVELHLHPEWQSKILSVLLNTFPGVQFICTTHSPHVIQVAEANQIVALEMVDGNVRRRFPSSGQYGFRGWTIEEVLLDVMGMDNLRTAEFSYALRKFDSAIDNELGAVATDAYNSLSEMLHPSSNLRKLLKLQLAGVKGYDRD